jgi:hypothetical protein
MVSWHGATLSCLHAYNPAINEGCYADFLIAYVTGRDSRGGLPYSSPAYSNVGIDLLYAQTTIVISDLLPSGT